MGLVEAIFSREEADMIKKILISQGGSSDRLIWRYTSNGIFFVKNACHLQGEVQDKING